MRLLANDRIGAQPDERTLFVVVLSAAEIVASVQKRIAKYPVFRGGIDQRNLCARRPIRQIGNGAGKFLSGLLS